MGKKSLVRSKERPTERDERRPPLSDKSATTLFDAVCLLVCGVCVENVKKM